MLPTPRFIPGADSGPTPNPDPIYYDGMNNFSVDGSRYDPMFKGVGVDQNWTSEGVNDQIEGKVVVVQPRYNRQWQVEYPVGCLLFGSADCFEDQVKRNQGQGRKNLFRGIDRMEVFTPEQLNYHLHMVTLDPTVGDKDKTIDAVFAKWRLLGVNITPAVTSAAEFVSYQAFNKRIGEERVLVYRPFADEKVINYWGNGFSGQYKPYLFMVLKLHRVESHDKSGYVLNYRGDDTRVPEAPDAHNSAGKAAQKPLMYIPRWTAVTGSNAICPSDEDLEYEEVIEEPKGKPPITVKKKGYYIRVGRVIRNPDYQKTSLSSTIHLLRDMNATTNCQRLDVMLNVREVEPCL